MELSELVRRALEYRGFTVVSDSLSLIARGVDGEYMVFVIRDASERAAMEDMEIQGKKLVISLEDGGEPAGDIYWSRADFERIVGRMFLEEATNRNPAAADIISSFEEVFAENPDPVAAPLSPSEIGNDISSSMASITELMPFHVIYFTMDTGDISDAGIIAVDASDGMPYRIGRPLNAIYAPDDAGRYNRRAPAIDSEEAMRTAVQYLISAHSREEESTVDMGAVTVVEKKTISPPEESIRTRNLGILYIPVIFAEKEEETLAVDASGTIGFRKHY